MFYYVRKHNCSIIPHIFSKCSSFVLLLHGTLMTVINSIFARYLHKARSERRTVQFLTHYGSEKGHRNEYGNQHIINVAGVSKQTKKIEWGGGANERDLMTKKMEVLKTSIQNNIQDNIFLPAKVSL